MDIKLVIDLVRVTITEQVQLRLGEAPDLILIVADPPGEHEDHAYEEDHSEYSAHHCPDQGLGAADVEAEADTDTAPGVLPHTLVMTRVLIPQIFDLQINLIFLISSVLVRT